MRIIVRRLLSLSLLALCPALIYAQGTQGSLAGLVRDASGAVIAGATLTVKNTGTAVVDRLDTDDLGRYQFPFLPSGDYEVQVEMAGFKLFKQTGVQIQGRRTTDLNIALEIGQVSESIEVTGQTPLLKTTDTALGRVFETKMVDDLPLNGRNPLQLLNLVPGTAASSSAGNPSLSIINGSRIGGNKVLIDGTTVNQEYSGFTASQGTVTQPNIQALGEFNVITSNFSAEYSRVMGAVVQMNLKSGTNEFHGDLWEFWRNQRLDAKDFFNTRGQKPKSSSHNFGAAVGGPLARNKLFFFSTYEGRRATRPIENLLSVPTEKMRRGDLSELNPPIFDPTTTSAQSPFARQPFAGNLIPSSRINSTAAKALELYPLPNRPGVTANYFVQRSGRGDRNSSISRVDYNLGSKDRLYGRFSIDRNDTGADPLFNNVANPDLTVAINNTWTIGLNEVHTFSPRLVNEFRASYLNNHWLGGSTTSLDWLGDVVGIPQNDPDAIGFPNFSITGFQTLGFVIPTYLNEQQILEFNDVVSYVAGRHNLRFGVQFRNVDALSNLQINSAGNYRFTGDFTNNPAAAGVVTGSGLADFLLGVPHGQQALGGAEAIVQAISPTNDANSKEAGLFVQDDVKVSSKLSVNLGLRWDYLGGMREKEGRIAAYDPASNTLFQKDVATNAAKNLLSPRLGLAYQVTSKTVVRSAFGMSYFPQLQGLTVNLTSPPFARTQALENRGSFYDQLVNPILFLGQPLPALPNPNAAFPVSVTPSSGALNIYDENIKHPSWLMWNLTIQRELLKNFSFELGYVGTKGVHMDTFHAGDCNKLRPDQYGPDENFGGLTPQQRLPYPNAGRVQCATNFGDSEYHGFQFTTDWRTRSGITFQSSYSWQKNFTNVAGRGSSQAGFRGGAGDQPYLDRFNNLRLNWAPDGGTPNQVFVASFIYELPFGAGKPLASGGGILGHVIGGWRAAGNYTARTGFYMGVSSSSAQGFPNRTCDGNLPRGQRTVQRWFDTSCFSVPNPTYSLGNAGFAYLTGPGVSNLDLSAYKTFRLFESKTLQFRADFYNFTNTPHFGIPGLRLENPNFGQITNSASSGNLNFIGNRRIELSLQFRF